MATRTHQARQPKRNAGFTLVELLVVVSIIALLISILLPSLKSAREQTRSVKCLANLRAIAGGVNVYAHEQRNMLPGPLHPPIYRNTGYNDPRFQPMSPTTTRVWFLLDRLAPYFTKSDDKLQYADAVATCPTAVMVKKDEDFMPNVGTAPEINPSHSHPYNYVPNTWGYTKPGYYFGWVNIGTTWTGFMNAVTDRPAPVLSNGKYLVPAGSYAPLNQDLVTRPSAEWMIGDAWWLKKTVKPNPSTTITAWLGTWQSDGNSHFPLPRAPYHGPKKALGTNLVYFDGHCGTFQGMDEWATEFPANPWRVPPQGLELILDAVMDGESRYFGGVFGRGG